MDNTTKKNLGIGIICGFPFPIGYSGTNRIISISRGLFANKQYVKVYLYKPTELRNNIINAIPEGEYKGVNFIYPKSNTVKRSSKVGKLLDLFFGFLFLFKNIYKDRNFLDCILIDTDRPHLVWIITQFLRRFLKTKIYMMVDEYPREIRIGKEKISKMTNWFYSRSLKLHDGLISMTKPLEDFYSKIIRDKQSIIIPMTVESDRFLGKAIKNEKSIVYIGNFDIDKDGVDILILAFSKVLKTHPDITLKLAGEGKKDDMEKVKSIINSFEIEDKVHIIGRLHRDKVPDFLMNAYILAMARPFSLRNQGGFPTKLGEYLLTSKPVLVTDIGDISMYLQDSKSIYLAKPGDPTNFALKLNYILENYNVALKVAEEGRRIALNSFDYIIQTKKLVEFLHK